MSLASGQFGDHLLPKESLRAVSTATLSDDSSRRGVSVGVTDRRILCVSEDGTFVALGQAAICSIRSRPRTSFTYRGNDYRFLFGIGGFVSALGLVAMASFTSGLLVPVLVLASCGTLVATVALHRSGGVRKRIPIEAIERRVGSDFDGVEVARRIDRRVSRYANPTRQLGAIGSFVAFCCLLGAAVFASTPLVVLFVLPLLGGIWLVDYASHRREEFDGIEFVRRHKQEVQITTADGRAVTLTSEPGTAIDQELSRLVFADDTDSTQILSAHS